MCQNSNKVKVELYLTPEELIELGKFLKRQSNKSVTLSAKDDGGDSGKGNN